MAHFPGPPGAVGAIDIVLIVSAAFGLLLSSVETTKVTVDEDLVQYWRTTYDILVRPAGSRSDIERAHGLVQANHLNELDAGITPAQVEAIRSIPGVEAAAPIAMIGYFEMVYLVPLDIQCEPGFYRLENSVQINDGLRDYLGKGREFFYCPESGGEIYHLFDSPYYNIQYRLTFSPEEYQEERAKLAEPGERLDFNRMPWPRYTAFRFPVLLAAIDPEQENRLLELEQAMVDGEYLHAPDRPGDIPLILNVRSYVDFDLRTAWKRIDLVLTQKTRERLEEAGGEEYLEGLPAITTKEWVFDGESAYPEALASVSSYRDTFNSINALSSGLRYRETTAPTRAEGSVVEAIPYGSGLSTGALTAIFMQIQDPSQDISPEMKFRESGVGTGRGGSLPFVVQGTYDIERIPLPAEACEVPLETYFPPRVTLRYDPAGRQVEPVELGPTFSDIGYIISPPLALTTLDMAARLSFNPERPVSAVRVRVAEVDQFTPEARGKIEQVAAEIMARTGLEVDITVGSSPKRTLVYISGDDRVPPAGYVEEGWVQKGVSYSIAKEVQRINVLLFSIMLLVSGVYILNTSLVSTLACRREIALQKALGWRSSAVFGMVVSEGILTGLIAGLLGSGLGLLLSAVLDLEMPLQKAFWILPLGLALCTLSSLLPAVLAARTMPAQTLARGEIAASSVRLSRLSIPAYALRQALQRRIRASLAILTMAISAALITLFLGIILYMRGYLTDTLLGETILVHIGPLHLLMAGISFLVAGFATADVLLMAVIERRREIGILKAIGWRDRKVFNLFVMEAVGLAGIAGLIGWGIGCVSFWYLYRTLPLAGMGLLLPALLIPVLVSALAAFYPARQAAQIPPVEAMRYE